jgi:ankyrin repeat protein
MPAATDQNRPSSLVKAVEAGSLPDVVRLIDGGASLEEKGQHGQTALFRALALGHREIVDVLVKRGANLKARADSGKRVLDAAMEAGHRPLVDRILGLGEPLIYVNNNAMTSLHWAAQSGDISLVREVLAQGTFTGQERNVMSYRALDLASSGEIFNLLVERFKIRDINPKLKDGNYSVHRFASKGKADIVRSMVERGVSVDFTGKDKNTILHYAAASGSTELVAYLLQAGAKANARNTNGFTPLHWIAETSNIAAARLLLDRGAKIDAQTNFEFVIKETQTPLYRAIEKRQTAMARFLIERGANVNILCDSSCNTALTAACQADDIELIDLLLTRGASPNGIVHPSGQGFASFPLYWASSREAVERLVRAGAHVHATERHGATALHWMVSRITGEVLSSEVGPKMLGALDALLEAGADPQGGDRHGRPPTALAQTGVVVERLLAGRGRKPDSPSAAAPDTISPKVLADLAFDMQDDEAVTALITALRAASPRAVAWASSDGSSILHLIAGSIAVDRKTALSFSLVREAMQIALDKGASINEIDSLWRNTPLHSVAQETSEMSLDDEKIAGFTNLIRFLLERGADKSIRNEDGERPADLVQHPALRQLLQ